MGILDSVASQVSGTTNTPAGAKKDRKPAELWLNIGIELPNPLAGQDGEEDTIFHWTTCPSSRFVVQIRSGCRKLRLVTSSWMSSKLKLPNCLRAALKCHLT